MKGQQKADLNWSGAASTNMDVYRSGVKIVTAPNDGLYTDAINQKAAGTYRVVGPIGDRVSLDFALEAKCYAPEIK